MKEPAEGALNQENKPHLLAYVFGPFRLELSTYRLLRDGEPLALTSAKAFDTLVALIERRQQVVSKDELLKLVWPNAIVTEDNLTHCISSLRRVLGDNPESPTIIATISRRGYRFIAPVAEIPADVRSSDVAPPSAESTQDADATGGPTLGAADDHPRVDVSMGFVGKVGGRRLSTRARVALVCVGLAAAVITGASIARRLQAGVTTPGGQGQGVVAFRMNVPEGTRLVYGAVVSPGGRDLAFIGQDLQSGKTQVWLRRFDSDEPRPVPDTEGASDLFWAPDGRTLGFFADYSIKKVSLNGDPSQTIATIGLPVSNGSWNNRDLILFAMPDSGLLSVSASGGAVSKVTELDPVTQDTRHRYPQFLPDGRHFLYYVSSADSKHAGTYVGELGSSRRSRLVESTTVAYAASGHLLFVRDRTLVAQQLDMSGLRLVGTPTTILRSVSPPVTISASGRDFVITESKAANRLTWFDRDGRRRESVGGSAGLQNPIFMTDDRTVLAEHNAAEGASIWSIDLKRGTATRLSDGRFPVPARAGRQFLFASRRRTEGMDIYRREIDRTQDELFFKNEESIILPNDWSPDGYLVYTTRDTTTRFDLWLLPMSGGGKPTPYLRSPANESQARVSPDGRWLAYTSDESGRREVYVQSFPKPGVKHLVSVNGGAQPQWRSDGHELFYLAPDNTINAVALVPGQNWEASAPAPLFRAPVVGNLDQARNSFAVSADGNRFLIDAVDESTTRTATVLLNWPEPLEGP